MLQDGVDVAYLRRDTRYSFALGSNFFFFCHLPFLFICFFFIYFQFTQPGLQHIQAGVSCFHCYAWALVAFGLLYLYARIKMVLLNDCTYFLAFDKKKEKKNRCVRCQRRCAQKCSIDVARWYPVPPARTGHNHMRRARARLY